MIKWQAGILQENVQEDDLILTYWDLSSDEMLAVFRLSSRAESKSCNLALE